MWKKLFGDKDFESRLLKLTNDTGISRQQAEIVLRECNGDVELAKQRILAKSSPLSSTSMAAKAEVPSSSNIYPDAPPPYSETVEGAMSVPTAFPPPYVSQDKDVLLGELKAVFPSDTEERCCACFDRIQPDKSEGFSGEMIWQGLKVSKQHMFEDLTSFNSTQTNTVINGDV